MSQQLSVVPPSEEDTRAKLLFRNPEFKKDLNFTCRLGGNYAAERGIEVGNLYPIYDITDEGIADAYLGDAEVTHILTCMLKDIPKLVYTNEHDPECRNPIGLYWELREIYEAMTGRRIKPDNFITCIGFMVRP